MGLIRTTLTLSNPRKAELAPIEVRALADSGALHLCVPEHVAMQLDLAELEKREVTTADGRRMVCSYVGPVQVTFGNRGCFTGALVMGDEVLLGAVPMEDMDLLLSPAKQAVIINPENPNMAGSVVKSLGRCSVVGDGKILEPRMTRRTRMGAGGDRGLGRFVDRGSRQGSYSYSGSFSARDLAGIRQISACPL